ncbi:MAG: hypothetical protein IAE98_11635 [Candidatus Kapabacteria bacterium]|nr:hypothetical protein [Candidatus Kapabacteria bacterium]
METVEPMQNINVKMFDLKKNAMAVVHPMNLIEEILLFELLELEQVATQGEIANAKEGQIFTLEHLSFEQNGDDRIYHTYIEGEKVTITINNDYLKIEATDGEKHSEKVVSIAKLIDETVYIGDLFFGLLELVGIKLK